MRNLLSVTALALIVFSCQEAQKETIKEDVKVVEESIVQNEYTGTEPTKPEETEFYEPKVPVVTPGINRIPPSDAIVLFDGSSLEGWITAKDSTAAKWHLNKDGSMTVNDKSGDIQTKQNFGDVQLHIEWRSPAQIQREGQHRGNSGVFLNGLYEVQVLDKTCAIGNGFRTFR